MECKSPEETDESANARLPFLLRRPEHWTKRCACEINPRLSHVSANFEGHVGFPARDQHGICRAHLIWLEDSSAEFIKISKDFEKVGYTVAGIARVQNARQLMRFNQEVLDMELRSEPTTKEDLYHTTNAMDMDRVYSEGLDQRLARQGYFGRGIYASDDPRKADMYWRARPDHSSLRFTLRVKMLLGKVKQYPYSITARELMREPDGFDSVCGNVNGYNEYVVYHNDRAIIEHVVFYRVGGSPLVQTPSAAAQQTTTAIKTPVASQQQQQQTPANTSVSASNTPSQPPHKCLSQRKTAIKRKEEGKKKKSAKAKSEAPLPCTATLDASNLKAQAQQDATKA